MGLFDAIFRRNVPPKAKLDPFFALSTALISFTELGWTPSGKCGLVIKPATSLYYQTAAEELKELLQLTISETKSKLNIQNDEYGYTWLMFADQDWDDLVQLAHLSAQTLKENGYDTQLLAAVFPFQHQKVNEKMYLIYYYKRGTFYPFIPTNHHNKQRNHSSEQRVFTMLENELPWEKDTTAWYPLWGCPV